MYTIVIFHNNIQLIGSGVSTRTEFQNLKQNIVINDGKAKKGISNKI